MTDTEEIHAQFLSKDPKKRIKALGQLKDNFSQLSDKQQAYNDLIRLFSDQDDDVKIWAILTFMHIFSDIPDKQQACNVLIRLISDKDDNVRAGVAQTIVYIFSDVPDKQQAYNDLIRLISDQNDDVKARAVHILMHIFSDVPDKQQAWNDLIKLLISDQDDDTKSWVAQTIVYIFSDVPDKQQAYNDLIRLVNDQDDDVSVWAIDTLIRVFSDVSDKQKAWDDLIVLTDENSTLTPIVACALGSKFSQVPDQQQAWNDLIKLTFDQDSLVRSQANYSLGHTSIFKASQAENEENYKEELENAICFFEKASKESPNKLLNSAKFCLPFYHSFHSIIFKRQEAKEEVDKYLAEAKAAMIEGLDDNKETLLEAVENLAKALQEVRSLENLGFETKKSKLNFYREYLDSATELMRDSEKTAPFATIVMRKGLPILDRNLKQLLEEIQNKAKIACQVSQGTPIQEIACAVNKEVQKWEIDSQEEMTQMIENLAYILEEKISIQPKNQYILGKINQMKSERSLVKQYEILAGIIPLIQNVTVVPIEPVLEKIESLEGKFDAKFKEMIVSLKSGPREELVISKGLNIAGSGAQLVATIPLGEMKYPEINIDLEKIKEEGTKLSELPKRFFEKIKDYLP